MAAPATSSAPATESPRSVRASGKGGFRHYRRFRSQFQVAGQLGIGLIALWLAVVIRGQLPHLRGSMNLPTVAACAGILLLAMALGTAARTRKSGGGPRAFTLVPAATITILVFLFFLRSYGMIVSRPTILIFAVLATTALGAWDVAGERWLPRTAQIRNVILVGEESGAVAAALRQELAAGPWKVAARLDTGATAGRELDAALDRLRRLIREEPIDEVLIADSIWEAGLETRHFFRAVAGICEQAGVRLHLHADWLSSYRQVHLDYLGDCPIMTFSFSAVSPWALGVKRAADAVLSALLLAVLSPLLFGLGLAVKLGSPGPALFSQIRCGLRGRTFRIYKFRSMVANAEQLRPELAGANEMNGPVFKLSRDPRVTPIGRWLRRTSLDEMPQLWNVLRGEMSLVGPRPPLPDEVREYRLDSLHRLAMKPGMTGLWQVSGRSSIRDFAAWVALDAQYIRRWSLWLDCKILARTLSVVLRMSGQ